MTGLTDRLRPDSVIGFTGIRSKRSDGTLDPVRASLSFPYLIYTWMLWHVWRLCTREVSHHELLRGIRIGRRQLPGEFPRGVAVVFDLTAEFVEPRAIRDAIACKCYPTLDARPPDAAMLMRAAREVLDAQGGVYIHCANGHGRTGTLAGAVLLLSGTTSTVESTIEYLRARRPGLSLNRTQKAALAEFAHKLAGASAGPSR